MQNLILKQSPPDKRDWDAVKLIPLTYYPHRLDFRPYLTKIRHQGSQGTCVAQSACCIKEYQELNQNQLADYFSPQFIYNCRRNQNEEGMYCRDLMKILSKIGCVVEKNYPYGLIQNKDEINPKLFDQAKKYRILNYARVYQMETLKRCLYNNGPCLIAVPVYNNTGRMWYQRKGDKLIGHHAMTIVGYNSKGFIIRNSWGKYFGKDGYTLFPYIDWGRHNEVWTTLDLTDKPKRVYLYRENISDNEFDEILGENFDLGEEFKISRWKRFTNCLRDIPSYFTLWKSKV